ncbi:MAG TPA: helix-turn-helix transcriptional regulator [Thermoanaerobaculia bacterium]|nr:helix-turn-helix transcriptional regulator [Thermoanaerobaculia bacterium]
MQLYVRSISVISTASTPTPYRVLPTLGPVLGFQFRGRISVRRDSGDEPLARSGITGIQSTAKLFVPDADTGTVLVRFSPFGAYRLFGCSMNALTNAHVPLTELVPHIREIEARVSESSADQAEAIIRRWIETTFEHDRATIDPNVLAAEQRIRASGGREPIERVADQIHVGRRQLERLFRTQVGVTPKEFASLVRFRRVLARIQTRTSWADLADEAGYADQAHFVRNFVRRTGMTPTEYAP